MQVGDPVKKDDPLFFIDDREAAAQVAKTKALVNQRNAEWENNKDQLSIYADITNARAVSQDERNQRGRAVEVAKAVLDAAKSDLDASRTRLNLHTVRAPIDGVVMTMNLRVGQFAPAGETNTPLRSWG